MYLNPNYNLSNLLLLVFWEPDSLWQLATAVKTLNRYRSDIGTLNRSQNEAKKLFEEFSTTRPQRLYSKSQLRLTRPQGYY